MAIAKRQVFYSFHYANDYWRASMVRSIGVIEGNNPVSDNDWEQVKIGGDDAIKKWIKEQMEYRSCTLVLVGNETANRKWINHEIIESWNSGMGVAAISIHGLEHSNGYISTQGRNPFDFIRLGSEGKLLSSAAKFYVPGGSTSRERYRWISTYLSAIVEEAISIRNKY